MDKQEGLNRLVQEFSECQKVLTAIGDETRQSIIIALIECGCEQGIRVGEITKKTHLSRPAVSHHLKVLKDANIIEVKREGTKNYYSLTGTNSAIFKVKRLFDNIESFITESSR
ncbi:ArsR/SmtB family transcription factor [Shimazuella kribbensis]|uniref:ArsR/SmtB family transcription factor n=1 Tax=Shimazuella kribbensis TaxID=139808 RepID=UPI0003F87FEC|nr:metalloregulator ArsR/SmtB family transcription factor [Shimazuella kribbensis]